MEEDSMACETGDTTQKRIPRMTGRLILDRSFDGCGSSTGDVFRVTISSIHCNCICQDALVTPGWLGWNALQI